MNSFWSFIAMLAAAYGALTLLLYFTQDSMIYYPNIPSRQLMATPERVELAYEEVELTTEDGIRLHGWFLEVDQPRATLLFFHGNAGNISHRLDSLQLFHQLGLEVFIFDYRGYGRSEGKPSEKGTYRDADAAWRYLTEQRQIPPRRIMLFGRSLGASVAVDLAARKEVLGLIIESAFSSVPDMAADIYPYLPVRWLSRFRYDSGRKLPVIKAPVLVAHSPQDEIIPFHHGRKLFSLANEPKRFLEMRGGHNDGFLVSGTAYRKGLDEFIRRLDTGGMRPED
jgi:fermentation-respiration switch protein FrsA (DUF1100 family)